MNMRNPLIWYILSILSGGVVLLYWLMKMAEDVKVDNIRLKNTVLAILFIIYVAGVIYPIYMYWPNHFQNILENMPRVYTLMFLALVIYVMIFHYLFSISAYCNNNGVLSPKGIKLFLLTLFYVLSIPILQSKLNQLAQKKTPNKSNQSDAQKARASV